MSSRAPRQFAQMGCWVRSTAGSDGSFSITALSCRNSRSSAVSRVALSAASSSSLLGGRGGHHGGRHQIGEHRRVVRELLPGQGEFAGPGEPLLIRAEVPYDLGGQRVRARPRHVRHLLDLAGQILARGVHGQQLEADDPGRDQLVSAVLALGDARGVRDAPVAVQRVERVVAEARQRAGVAALLTGGRDLLSVPDGDHTEPPCPVLRLGEQIADEGAIPLLEDVQRQHQAGEERRTEREERKAIGHNQPGYGHGGSRRQRLRAHASGMPPVRPHEPPRNRAPHRRDAPAGSPRHDLATTPATTPA